MRFRIGSMAYRWRFRILMFGSRRFNRMAKVARKIGDWCVDRAAHLAAAAHRWPLVLAVAAGTALAAPPPVGSEDWEILAPHAEWIQGLQRNFVSCCNLSDGRPVDARTVGDRWQVRFRPGSLANAPLGWVDVPPDAVMPQANPVGMPIAFWVAGRVLCFVPAGAI